MRQDIAALLTAPAEGAKRELIGASEPERPFTLDRVIETGVSKDLRKAYALLKRASRAFAQQDFAQAARIALRALDIDETIPAANHLLAIALHQLGHLSKALAFYERALELDPGDKDIYLNLGLAAWKLDMLEGAETFFRLYCQMDAVQPDGAINLAGVLRDQGRFDDAVELLRTRIYAAPEQVVLWNALGSVLLEQGRPEEADDFFLEAIRLDPDFARGWHNLAYAQSLAGDMEASIESARRALSTMRSKTDRAETRHSLAQSLLGVGRVAEGWEEYTVRLEPDYESATLFLIDRPRWRGEDVAGKSVLLVGEQGLGDEVLFMNAVPDLLAHIGPEGQLTIAPEKRLAPLVARSFPSARVLHHGTLRREGRAFRTVMNFSAWDEIDCWAAMGEAVRRFRPDVAAFPNTARFLTADPDRVADMRARLAALPAGPKVGLAWKSKLMTAKRSKYFSPFEQWRPVLATPGAVFVNMQYGDVGEEVALAQEQLGVTIHQLADVDLMDDLDGVTALGVALDLFIGPMNASTNLTAAAGGLVWLIAVQGHWPMLATGRMPWYPRARVFTPPAFGAWDDVMSDVAAALADFSAETAAA